MFFPRPCFINISYVHEMRNSFLHSASGNLFVLNVFAALNGIPQADSPKKENTENIYACYESLEKFSSLSATVFLRPYI